MSYFDWTLIAMGMGVSVLGVSFAISIYFNRKRMPKLKVLKRSFKWTAWIIIPIYIVGFIMIYTWESPAGSDSSLETALTDVSNRAGKALERLGTAESWTAALAKHLIEDRDYILRNLDGLPDDLLLQRLVKRLSERTARQKEIYLNWHAAYLEKEAEFAEINKRLEKASSVEERAEVIRDLSLHMKAHTAMKLGDGKFLLHHTILEDLLKDVEVMNEQGYSSTDIIGRVDEVLIAEYNVRE